MPWARIATLAALLGMSLGGALARASTPSPIVFAADCAPSVSGEIYRLDPTGRRVDLSRSSYQDTAPAVSPDGKRVAFGAVESLAWSPDGTRFVLTARTTKTGPFDVYTVKTDGTNPVRLTKNYDAVGASWR